MRCHFSAILNPPLRHLYTHTHAWAIITHQAGIASHALPQGDNWWRAKFFTISPSHAIVIEYMHAWTNDDNLSIVLPMHLCAADISQIYNSMEAVPRVLCCSKACMHVVLKTASWFLCGRPFCNPSSCPPCIPACFSTSTGLPIISCTTGMWFYWPPSA